VPADDDRPTAPPVNPFDPPPPPPAVENEIVNIFVGEAPTEEQYELARSLLHENAAFPMIRERLLHVGATAQQADLIVRDLGMELAQVLFVAGAARHKVEAPLYDRGLDVTQVRDIIDALERKYQRVLRATGVQSGRLYFAACTVFILGIVVGIANFSGILTTHVGAGRLLMALSGVIAFYAHFRRRRSSK
jgi:hypothetical protein